MYISPFPPVCLVPLDADRRTNLLSFSCVRGTPRVEIGNLTRIKLGMLLKVYCLCFVLTHRCATSPARSSRDDDHPWAVYNPPGPPYQVAPPQAPYNPPPAQYALPNPLSHALAVPSQAFPSQPSSRAIVPPQAFPPQHSYHAQGPYASPLQPPAPAPWIPPPPKISNTESGNTENSNFGESYINRTTTNAQVAAQMNNTSTVFIQNLHISHQPSDHQSS